MSTSISHFIEDSSHSLLEPCLECPQESSSNYSISGEVQSKIVIVCLIIPWGTDLTFLLIAIFSNKTQYVGILISLFIFLSCLLGLLLIFPCAPMDSSKEIPSELSVF